MIEKDQIKPKDIQDLFEQLKYILDSESVDALLQGDQITLSIKKSGKLSINDIQELWNQWAVEHGKAPIRSIKGKRLQGTNKILKEFPSKAEWTSILKGVEKDSWWYSIMDFDKLYRNEMFYKFYELGVDDSSGDPLAAFFQRYQGGDQCK